MSPKRIQRQRTKGWRMPEGAVYVGRPSPWGNRWLVDEPLGRELLWDAQTVVDLYRSEIESDLRDPDPQIAARRWNILRSELAGRDLACWCPLDQPCHADVLLELANREPVE